MPNPEDPRGHNDGDWIVGNGDKRADAMDFEFKAFLESLAQDGGDSLDDLIEGCSRAILWIKKCQSVGNKLHREELAKAKAKE